jgi:hypothetical protein
MAAVFGFLAGLFGAITLLAFGTIPLESPLVTVLPILGLLLAFVLAMWAPVGAAKTPPSTPESSQVDPDTI